MRVSGKISMSDRHGGYLKCGWWLGRLGARWRGITMPSLLPTPTTPPPSKFEGKVLGFLTSETERITSWNCCVLSASFWAIRAILSLNFLGLLPAMSSLVQSFNHNRNENFLLNILCSQQMWWLLFYHCSEDKDFNTLKLHIPLSTSHNTTDLYFWFSQAMFSSSIHTEKDL